MRVALWGCGYTAQRLLRLRDEKIQWLALSRSAERVAALRQRFGIEAQAIDLDCEYSLSTQDWDALVYMVPPPSRGRIDSRTRGLLAQLQAPLLSHSIVFSATGVYGDCRGQWIDETQVLAPVADRSHRRCDAERQWRTWAEDRGVGLSILRVSGIYGPDRLPRKRLLSGAPILQRDQAPFSNRIHVQDLARLVLALLQQGPAGVVNVADDAPSSMSEYFLQVAQALSLPAPPQVTWAQAEQVMSEGMLSYLRESRRIDNQKMKALLGESGLCYPTLAQGLRASIDAEQALS